MDKKITIYSTQQCQFCKLAKAYLDEHKIPYTDIDVTTDQRAQKEMIEKSNQMGVPVIDIDGQIIVGFDKGAINAALGL